MLWSLGKMPVKNMDLQRVSTTCCFSMFIICTLDSFSWISVMATSVADNTPQSKGLPKKSDFIVIHTVAA